MDQAVWYVGITIGQELDEASKSKVTTEEQRAKLARQRVLEKYFGENAGAGPKYADPFAAYQKQQAEQG